ncbi:hypothetical protein, partial [Pedobacter nototheniae]|uniref:hypothetical protein n=1 Tax=Pedobacter nototheniae TaxID=2488994 RepID=UPI001B8B7413
ARRSITNLSELGAEKSPESAARFRPHHDSLEAQLRHKLQARTHAAGSDDVLDIPSSLDCCIAWLRV